MAAFDRPSGSIVVRIVYDGPPGAGKTENLRRLVASFSTARRGELVAPRAEGADESSFEWLTLQGGVIAGHPLQAQLVTVPGKSVLSRRRWPIVTTADVIVFVCESSTTGVREARRWFELLRGRLSAMGARVPIVVQANKQDVANAASAEEISWEFRLDSTTEVITASAATGEGVRETVARAMRAAAEVAERELVARGEGALPDAGDELALLASLGAAAGTPGAGPPLPAPDPATGEVWPGTRGRARLRALARALEEAPPARLLVPSDRIAFRAGSLRLETSRARRFPTVDAARAAMLALARAQLGTEEDAIYALATDANGTWVWSIAAEAKAETS